jgi:hypothetical protein
MEIDWRKVAVSLNTKAHAEMEIANDAESPEAAREFRIRSSILMAVANALFDGLPQKSV